MTKKGLFIVFEGPDGAGKTSVLAEVVNQLTQEGHDQIFTTREPGGNLIAEKIRDVILSPLHATMDERTEALLYAAARRQHLVEQILPQLEQGKLVICDRFVASSIAYQGYGREIGADLVWQINHFAIGDSYPDATFFFDVPVELGLARIEANQGQKPMDRLEQEKIEFHHRVYAGYKSYLNTLDRMVYTIDASQAFSQVVATTKGYLQALLSQHNQK